MTVSGSAQGVSVASSRRHVVLCVDDDAAVLAALRRLFRGEPYEVVTATKPAHALSYLRHLPVKVVITDERMPDTNGSELLGEVSQHWPKIGRVILTGYPGHMVMSEGFWAGVDFLFHKPWDDESLRAAIRQLINDRETEPGIPQREAGQEAEYDLGGEGG
jgi:DNA-binding NtrC family response regulator